jgi:phosphoadenosine phosphosulfate reductase
MNGQLDELVAAAAGLDAQGLVALALERFPLGRVALASSMGPEDQVLTDMLARTSAKAQIFTLDTGRLPQETHDLIDATRKHYGLRIEVVLPEAADVGELVNREGVNLFYNGVELRRACCHVRKVLPLRRRLAQLDAWMTGLRREQSVTRRGVCTVEWDSANGLIKISPLANWTHEQVWQYIRRHGVPVSALHARGYPSIGCAPCTRAVASGEDARSGRWWWERTEHKECGLHRQGPRQETIE